VTIVIALQGLVATLAGLLLLEARVRRGEVLHRAHLDDDRVSETDFRPELIVAWDDEANYARKRPCTRSAGVEGRESRRPQPVGSNPNRRIR
jgi:hypothetical protein